VVGPLVLGLLAALSPVPGEWRSGSGVRFSVDRGSGLVQPAVRVRRCGRHRAFVVRPGFVAVSGRRFESRARIVFRRTVVRLHLTGEFTSRRAAHGRVRTRVRLRGAHRLCSTGMRPWHAHPRRTPPAGDSAPGDDTADDEDVVVDDNEGELEDGEYEEDEPDEDPGDEDPDDTEDPDVEP
jgi:hypothetical protein